MVFFHFPDTVKKSENQKNESLLLSPGWIIGTDCPNKSLTVQLIQNVTAHSTRI